MDFQKEMLQRYFDFCIERHGIYVRRFIHKEEPPWTDDEILRKYKFTNVYRELDRVTIWIRKHIRELYADDKRLYFNLAVARQFNWPDTLAMFGFIRKFDDEDVMQLVRFVEKFQMQGNKIFTGAFMISAPSKGSKYTSKVHYIFEGVLKPLWDAKEPAWDTIENATKWFMQFRGFGGFMSYEVVSDMRWTRYLENAPDRDTWAYPGPGARRGLNRICGLSVKSRELKMGKMIKMMAELVELSDGYLPGWMPLFEARTVEHTLCEFDKYERVRLGQGRPRSLYRYNKPIRTIKC